MALPLPLTDVAMADCQSHAAQCSGSDPSIHAYLTRHVNGLMCAEIESVVTRLVRRKLETGCGDRATLNFVRSLRRSAIRNATFVEIRDTLKLFGSDYGSKFSDLVHDRIGEEGISKLGIAVLKRNTNGHRSPPDITFRELEEAYNAAALVVDAVKQTLENHE